MRKSKEKQNVLQFIQNLNICSFLLWIIINIAYLVTLNIIQQSRIHHKQFCYTLVIKVDEFMSRHSFIQETWRGKNHGVCSYGCHANIQVFISKWCISGSSPSTFRHPWQERFFPLYSRLRVLVLINLRRSNLQRSNNAVIYLLWLVFYLSCHVFHDRVTVLPGLWQNSQGHQK